MPGIRLLLAFLLVLAPMAVYAHSWYDAECCSDKDCHPIPPEAVREEADGAYTILASGEKFYPPGTHKTVEGYSPEGGATSVMARVYKWSKDGSFHRCTPNGMDGSSYTFCLYVPPPGV